MSSTCGVRLAVVLTTVLHFDRREAERLDHLVRSFTPVGGGQSQDGERQGQCGQRQGEQGARAAGHVLQHGQAEEEEGVRWTNRGQMGQRARGPDKRDGEPSLVRFEELLSFQL